MAIPPETTAAIWQRLLDGQPLESLGLSTIDGRLDLRGITCPEPTVLRSFPAFQRKLASATLAVVGGLLELRGVQLANLDMSRGRLSHLRLHDCLLENCVFDRAICEGWRMWGTTICDARFRSANLRSSALSGVAEDAKRNMFRRVDFTKADLRGTVHKSADFVGCIFSDTKLKGVEFNGDVFVDCKFEGTLDEVLFYRRAFGGESLPPNEMRGVDLSRARLRHVEFRELDMNDVVWPTGDEHIVVNNYVEVLDRALEEFRQRSDTSSRVVTAILDSKRKWAGTNQRVGVISKIDLREAGGEAAVGEFLRICRSANGEES